METSYSDLSKQELEAKMDELSAEVKSTYEKADELLKSDSALEDEKATAVEAMHTAKAEFDKAYAAYEAMNITQ